jgi:methylmalonyl-CoA/ethylmalonyl-CoA epimerase
VLWFLEIIQENEMKLEKFDHVGMTVKNLDVTLKFYTDIMGVKDSDIQKGGRPGVMRTATITTSGGNIEFLEFADPKEPLLKYADSKFDNIHHYAVNVDNIEEALSVIKKQGGTLIHEKPMQTPTGRKIAFVLPPNSKVLIELLED